MKFSLYILLLSFIFISCEVNKTHIDDNLPEGIIKKYSYVSTNDKYNFSLVIETKKGYKKIFFTQESSDLSSIFNVGDTIIHSNRTRKFNNFKKYNLNLESDTDTTYQIESLNYQIKEQTYQIK